MNRRRTVISSIALTTLVTIGGVFAQQAKLTGSIPVKDDDEAVFAGIAKIPIESAMKEALKTVPGMVVKAELEDENGYLVYGIEIAKADREIADVKVDAGNGKVLKVDAARKDHEDRAGEDSDNGHEEGDER